MAKNLFPYKENFFSIEVRVERFSDDDTIQDFIRIRSNIVESDTVRSHDGKVYEAEEATDVKTYIADLVGSQLETALERANRLTPVESNEYSKLSETQVGTAKQDLDKPLYDSRTYVQHQTFLKEGVAALLQMEKSIARTQWVRITLDESYKCSDPDLGLYKIEYEYPLHLIHLGADLHRANLTLSENLRRKWFIE